MDNFYLEFLRSQENASGFYAPLHHHSCYELVYYIKGSGTFTIEGESYTYRSNTFSILPPGAVHDENTHDTSSLLYIGFRYYDAEVHLKQGVYTDTEDHYVYRMLKILEQEFHEKKLLYSSMLNTLTQQLFIGLVRLYFSDGLPNSDNSIDYIQRYIDEHCISPLSHQELAVMSGYSYDWFRHLFKEKTGYALSQYIIMQKLKIAAGLLTQTNQSVTQIAIETNFSNASQFISCFHRQYKMTPLKYRKRYQDIEHVVLSNTEGDSKRM